MGAERTLSVLVKADGIVMVRKFLNLLTKTENVGKSTIFVPQ